MIHIRIVEIFTFCDVENLVSFRFCKKFTFMVKQFQCIPLSWVMTRGDDNAPSRLCHTHSQFGCGRRSQSNVNDIITNSHQRSTHHVLHHLT